MTEFISNLIGNDILATAIMSLIPLIELKGGIIFARGAGLGFFESLGLAYIGSTIVFIPIFFLLRPVLALLKKIKFIKILADKIENYIQKKANGAVEKQSGKKKSENFIKQLAVFIFVAIPLPMTGVWMGTAIAVFLNMKFKDSILPVVLGNLSAGLIISGLAELCILIFNNIKVLDYILYGLFALALILLVITIIKVVRQKPEQENEKESQIDLEKGDN